MSQLLLLLITSQSGLCASVAGEQLTRVMAGELQLTLLSGAGGIRIDRLLDRKYGQDLLTTNPLPLFSLTLQRAGSTNRLNLRADTGWSQCSIQPHGSRLKMHWSLPLEKGLAGLSVTAEVSPEIRTGAFRWKLRVGNTSTNWSVRRTVFPQVALADLGTNAVVLVPRGPGVLERGVWHRPFGFGGTYPNGWCSMQFMAAYRDGDRPAGLYVATHDPWGSTKDLSVKSEPTTHTMRLSFDHPAPDLGRAGNDFVLPGEAVWQLLRGDWFDAAMIYKHWAQREAKWWPRLARDGRKDTPRWMRDLNVWAMNLGAPDECVPAIKQFRDFLGMPLGFHWYNWHQIPFDNDYPHYFPTRAGFDQGVADLQSVGVFVMPYINGRLWDSHDRGADDFQFSRLALAAVARRDDGSPYLETYNSKETNGEPVRLGVMCPATPLWQNTVSNIVLRLLSECGTSAVYIDQVAAASPVLCQNPAHGHPLGGGHWWNGSYWKMLGAIRQVMPPGVALTTECNAEPFIRWFDGYLTWHWQFPGQVPAFPAIYGGAIQMFGRAYRGGATKDLALRMKAGQQLVFGEQLGWLDPGAVKEPENARFFREMARLRSQLSRYFSAGEMARPPRLLDSVPTVRADWQWSGEWWVTTEAVLTGAWKLPREKRMVLLFVNVGDKPVPNRVQFDAAANGIRGRMLRAQRRTADGHKTEWEKWPAVFDRAVTFPPRQAEAWELKW
ncbi:MAG TPA: DUF6259 domain-containing protein [Candidatus Paceibacterota bacterium]|nr:DUF6259 domain-containing protein [Candidatus Paceibacterota bacterium]